MNIEQVRVFALSLKGVTEDMPFGDDCLVFRVEGKIFMCLLLSSVEAHFALKLSPERNEELRALFSFVTPAWHWNKIHWSDVYFEQANDELSMAWIKESYHLVVSKLPKKLRVNYE